MEVRVWQPANLYMSIYQDLAVRESSFVLKRSNGNWSAVIIRDTVKFVRKNEIKKIIRKKLDEPKMGWEVFWKQLKDAEILTLPNGTDVGVYGGSDCGSVLVEAKVSENYRLYEYSGCGSRTIIKEAEQMLEAISKIVSQQNEHTAQ